MMKTLFRELLVEAKRANPSAAATLRPGLPRDVVEKRLATLPYEITPDAASLYEWADGADGRFELLPCADFIPLEKAMDRFRALHRLPQEMDREEQPCRDCFRFLGGYAFGRVDSPSKGGIVQLCIRAPWQVAFPDLEHLLKTSIECYREGVMQWDDLSRIRRFYGIGRRLNPGYKVWGTERKRGSGT